MVLGVDPMLQGALSWRGLTLGGYSSGGDVALGGMVPVGFGDMTLEEGYGLLPLVDRVRDTCENFTFPQLLLRAVKNQMNHKRKDLKNYLYLGNH